MGESKCYNLTEADKANINGFLISVGIKKESSDCEARYMK